MRPPLEVRDLVARYGRREVLAGIGLRVTRGELVGVLGANGSGKTTLLRCVSGGMKAEGGTIQIAGRSIDDLRPVDLARRVAVVPQDYDLPSGFSVRDLVGLGRYPHVGFFASPTDRDRAAVDNAIDVLGLGTHVLRQVQHLSGGERQMVVLAMALAQEPELLLLDEPTTHLDVRYQATTMDTLSRLSRGAGLAALAVLHDIGLAERYCDRVILLGGGRILADGPPEEVLTATLLSACFGLEPDFFAPAERRRQASFSSSPGEDR